MQEDSLNASKFLVYEGRIEDHTLLSAATKMMTIKTDQNLSENCVDVIADFVKYLLP